MSTHTRPVCTHHRVVVDGWGGEEAAQGQLSRALRRGAGYSGRDNRADLGRVVDEGVGSDGYDVRLVGGENGRPPRLQVEGHVVAAALFQPHGKVRARPGPSGEALCMAAPCKRHVVNDATRSLRV